MSKLIAITVDYETWHPIPEGKQIDWEKDIFQPAETFLRICDQTKVKLTFMAEIGEYFWLKQNNPGIAQRMEKQWIEAVRLGHDIQLHLHPNWLPELGARYQNSEWYWDWAKAKLGDYQGDLTALISNCKSALELLLQSVEPNYHVTSFRAGAYQVQPFKKLYDALTANGLYCDSSVYAGGYSAERGYDFRLAYSNHQPYFANAYDPQLKAPPGEKGIVEIPIFTFKPNERWFLDDDKRSCFAGQLLNYFAEEVNKEQTSEAYRRSKWFKQFVGTIYYHLRPFYRWLNPVMPKSFAHFMTFYGPESLVGMEYFVMIGHTKGDYDFKEIAKSLHKLEENGRFEFMTLSEMAEIARKELLLNIRKSAQEEADYQVKRECQAVLNNVRNEAQSHYLQDMIPLDRKTILDLGCGAGYWSDRISKLYPWMYVTGIDCGVDFIAKAQDKYASERVTFQVADFMNLPFPNESFDCIYADNTLEHAYDVDKTLQEIFRILRQGGILVAAIPSDARNPCRICDNHTWKTAPHEVSMRLENSGFFNIEIHEVDTFRKLGMPPYPPSDDKMMYIKAWKRSRDFTKTDRALEVMGWVYHNISPEKNHESNDPKEILIQGFAWCAGLTVVLKYVLEHENYRVRRVLFYMKPHPKGFGDEKIDTHSCMEVEIDNKWHLFDPMCNVYFNGYSLSDLINDPKLAESILLQYKVDDRYKQRGYDLYCSKWAYERCFKVQYEKPTREFRLANLFRLFSQVLKKIIISY